VATHAALDGARWRRAVVVGLTLLVGSLVPSPFARHEVFDTYGPDKWLHFLGHGAFAAALAEAFGHDGRTAGVAGLGAIGVSTLLGLTVGYLQQYVPGRVPERADQVAGVLGSIAGVGWWSRTTE